MTAPAPAPAAPPQTPAEWAAVATLGDDARALATAVDSPRALVAALADRALHLDATRLLAHLLPRREAVWWALSCARAAAGAAPPPAIAESLAATERWILHPTDEHRRAAMAAAERADLGTAAGMTGLAAFLSAGSIAPPEAPHTPPGDFLAAKAVAGAVVLATVAGAGSPEWHRAFIDQGVRVGQGLGLWPS